MTANSLPIADGPSDKPTGDLETGTKPDLDTSKKLPGAIALKNSVKEALVGVDKAGEVRSRIVADFAEKIVVKRIVSLTKALSARDDIDKKHKAIKASRLVGVDQETGKESFAFAKKEIEERKKLGEKLAKLDKAIDAAIAEPSPESYSKLAQAVDKASK